MRVADMIHELSGLEVVIINRIRLEDPLQVVKLRAMVVVVDPS